MDLGPGELEQLLDAAERPRVDGWSLRAALTRYAQPQPQRASAILELVRRIESALRPHARALSGSMDGVAAEVLELLEALVELDRLGDVLATWAVARAGERPDAAVDEVVGDVTARLERLGVHREARTRPSGPRRG